MAAPPTSLSGLPSLSADQQKLLLAALTSNDKSRRLNMDQFRNSSPATDHQSQSTTDQSNRSPSEGVDPSVINSLPSQEYTASISSQPTFGGGLIPDFVNDNNDFDVDVDLPDNDDDDGYYLDSAADGDVDAGEKRKSPEDDSDEDEDGDSKRRQSSDKGPKKPGRKPLTSEPTTKRKAQNRAAQRAFRERKEKHLKDLEQKVEDLEKASESVNHENDLLKAQITRLQSEVQDYRKRLSVAGTALTGSPIQNDSSPNRPGTSTNGNTFDFSFDFPIFGQFSPNGSSNGPPSVFDANDSNIKQEPSSNSNSSANTPQNPLGFFSNAASPSSVQSLGNQRSTYATNGDAMPSGLVNFSDATFGFGSVVGSPQGLTNGKNSSVQSTTRSNSTNFQQISESSASNAASPSNSSISHHGPGSSAATSPEPATNLQNGDFSSMSTQKSTMNGGFGTFESYKSPAAQTFDIDFNNFQFDPSLFGTYRETQEAIIGEGEFTGGLYDDYLNFGGFESYNSNTNGGNAPKKTAPAAMVSPLNSNEPQSPNVNEQIPKPSSKLEEHNSVTYNKMWEQLSTCPKFQQGELDIDSLCSELSKKATCSEKGASIPKAEWEAALWRLVGQEQPEGEASPGVAAAAGTRTA